jgi:hypothetical protein
MGWQDAAAWVGAILGILNLLGALLSKRPAFMLRPCDASRKSDGPPALLTVATSQRPVLLRSLNLWPPRKARDKLYVEDRAESKRQIQRLLEWHETGKFCLFVEESQVCNLRIEALSDRSWRIIVIRWSDDRWQPFPFYVRVLRRTKLIELNDAFIDVDGIG